MLENKMKQVSKGDTSGSYLLKVANYYHFAKHFTYITYPSEEDAIFILSLTENLRNLFN